jgi:CRISPR-associated protein Cmr2
MPQLIEIAFGPVQDFIAAARRTADLWAGSRLLSEVARAAGQSLLADGAQLIYPAEERVRNRESHQSNISNVLLAQIDAADAQPAEIATRAIAAARRVLAHRGEDALKRHPNLRQDIFRAQLQDALEAYAAWAELPAEEDYRISYKKLKTAFAQRKNTRDFLPFSNDGQPLPKNSFDGLRETVLPEEKHWRGKWRELRLNPGEQLDALGVLKRMIGREDEGKFTPLTRLAAHDWLEKVHQKSPDKLEGLRQAYEPLVKHGIATRVQGNQDVYRAFPYDAALLYQERLQGAYAEAEECDDPQAAKDALKLLEKTARPIWRQCGHPLPYAAILVADGDRMGKFVAAAQTAEHHKTLTRALAKFADEAIKICRDGSGQAIYAGGEDVMALLPLSAILTVPAALSKQFGEDIAALYAAPAELGHAEQAPTLRVGVAIAHILQPLGTIRDYGDAAEKYAKGLSGTDQQGNALGLRLHIRAGHVLSLRLPFQEKGEKAETIILKNWIRAYKEGKFSTRLGYEMRGLADRIRTQKLPDNLVENELSRLLDKVQESGGQNFLDAKWKEALIERIDLEKIRKQPEQTPYLQTDALHRLGEELIFARWLSAHSQADLIAGEHA